MKKIIIIILFPGTRRSTALGIYWANNEFELSSILIKNLSSIIKSIKPDSVVLISNDP